MAGTSNFPESVDNYTPLTDGVDVIQADDENNSYVAHNKTQNFIGASGAPQTHNTDILAQIFGAKDVLGTIKLSYVGVGTVRASAGIVLCENAVGTIRKLRRNTATVDITFADLDTGSEQPSTKYYVYAVADATATTVTFKISTSPTAPTGVTTFKLIGWFFNDASSNITQESVTSVAGMKLIQRRRATNNAHISTTSMIPFDNTIPQNTEGVEVVTVKITPKSANSILIIEFATGGSTSANVNHICCALFKDSVADAIYGIHAGSGWVSGSPGWQGSGKHEMQAGSSSEITFKLRVGGHSGNSITINGFNQRPFGDIPGTFIQVEEYEI